MPVETKVWRIAANGLLETQKTSLKLEADLHRWIEADPRLVHADMMLLGSQVPTDYGGRIDLLGIDSEGVVHVVELKRDKTPREVVAQALDYASWIKELDTDRIAGIYAAYKKADLAIDFQDRFGSPLPESLGDHSIMIVASSLDASSERIVEYLSEFGLDINAVLFSVFDDGGGGQLLTRTWLIDPDELEIRTVERSSKQGDWTGFYFVNVGVDKNQPNDRFWEDAEKFGFISAGDEARFRDFMLKLQIGDRIFAYVKGRGYVGYGVVRSQAVMAKDFHVPDGRALFDTEVQGQGIRRHPDDPERAEYVVGIDWKKTYPVSQAQKYPGIFSIQQVVCRIYDSETARFLKAKFDVVG